MQLTFGPETFRLGFPESDFDDLGVHLVIFGVNFVTLASILVTFAATILISGGLDAHLEAFQDPLGSTFEVFWGAWGSLGDFLVDRNVEPCQMYGKLLFFHRFSMDWRVSGGTWMVTLGGRGYKLRGWEASGRHLGGVWRHLGGSTPR